MIDLRWPRLECPINGRTTEVGLGGFPAVEAITAIGADNKRSEVLQSLLFGDAFAVSNSMKGPINDRT